MMFRWFVKRLAQLLDSSVILGLTALFNKTSSREELSE